MTIPLPTIASRIMTTPGFTFGKTVEKLEHLFADSSAPTEVVHAVVASDPMLAALTLGQANLASDGVTRLSEAMRTVGLGGVLGMTRGFIPLPDQAKQTVAGVWQEGVACAMMMRLLARVVATHAPSSPIAQLDDETLSAAGLLHDIGSALAVVRFPAEYARAVTRQEAGEGPFATLLKSELGVDAGDLGYLLARNLNLPAVLTNSIRFHDRPGKAELHQEIVYAVHLARLLVRGLGFVPGPDRFIAGIDDGVLSRLPMRLDDYPPLLDRFLEEWEGQEMYEVGAR